MDQSMRKNGVLKWLKSMFRAKRRRKKGENPEPSSPKVTCIGQVRVKSRKEGKRLRSRSNRRHAQEQRWVQLPVTICRAFGADRNCLFPCPTTSCCVPRWWFKGREMDVVEKQSCGSRRRHVFEDIDFEAQGFEGCDPPNNALLLMRCTSHHFDQSYHLRTHQLTQQPHLNLTVYQSNLGKQSAKPTDPLQDIEDTTESEAESEENSEQESETREELGEERDGKEGVVAECIMLMMTEPKVSMEVSKETWVCTTDFIPVPGPERIKTDVPSKSVTMPQAPRCSCSYPPRRPKAMALKRCKSEPSKMHSHWPGIAAPLDAKSLQ